MTETQMIKEIQDERQKHEDRGELSALLVSPGVPPAVKLHAAVVLKQFYLNWLEAEAEKKRDFVRT